MRPHMYMHFLPTETGVSMDKKKKNRVIALVAAMFLCGILYLMLGPGGGRTDSSEADLFTAGGDSVEEVAETGSRETGDDVQPETSGIPAQPTDCNVYIYICGAVKNPGVYTFDHEPRVVEVLEQAGGFTKKADRASVNLAGALSDGSQVVVAEKGKSGNVTPVTGESGSTDGIGSKVNINTATLEQLKTLPGIGDVRARSIISYREQNGAFASIEDVKKVEGIKEGLYRQICDGICVK